MNTTDQTIRAQNYWCVLFAHKKSIAMLVLVCFLIAILTNWFNQLGLVINMAFSLCFGVPISMLETFFRTRKKPMRDNLINVLSVVLGCLFGTSCVYGYIVWAGYVPFGYFGKMFFINFGIAVIFSTAAFYFFWSQYRNQELTLKLRSQQLKAAELENLRQRAENRLLQSQMEPHFLFNTLANIQTLVDVDPKSAKTMISDLSYMLRSSLKNSSQDNCSLEQELALVRAYLSIARVRIGDRLHIEEQIDESLLNESVIPMILQPLVENAIKHGVEKTVGEVTLRLTIRQEAGKLTIDVTDDGKSNQASTNGHGISISNIQQRLANRYGSRATLVSERTPTGWHNRLTIPLTREA